MKARLAAVAGVLLATGAVAQDEPDFYPPDLERLEGQLATVRPAQASFYSGGEIAGCPAMIAKCLRKAYVRAGDIVLVGRSNGALVLTDFTAGGARSTHGWLPRTAIAPLPAPAATLAGWRGEWVRDDEANISLKPGKAPGSIAVAGDASWGTHDPERVKNGGINMGALEYEGVPEGDRLNVGEPGQYDCRVRMRLLPPYLIVADNGKCGGANVSFSGVYRRPK